MTKIGISGWLQGKRFGAIEEPAHSGGVFKPASYSELFAMRRKPIVEDSPEVETQKRLYRGKSNLDNQFKN